MKKILLYNIYMLYEKNSIVILFKTIYLSNISIHYFFSNLFKYKKTRLIFIIISQRIN